MKKYLIIIISAIVLLTSLSAHAADRNRNANFFLTLNRAFIEGFNFKDESTGLKLGTGYRFSDYAGFEVFYVFYGEISDAELLGDIYEFKSSALVVNAIVTLPIHPLFDLYVKAGIAEWDAKLENTDDATISSSADGTDPIYTLGFGYNIDHDSTIRFEYEYADYDDTEYNVISFGFQHNF